MGLDMYLTGDRFHSSVKKNPHYKDGDQTSKTILKSDDEKAKVDGFEVQTQRLKMGYWRKHAVLHGFIVKSFGPKDDNGKPEDNCEPIWLNEERLQTIIDALEGDGSAFEETVDGFFFGSEEWHKECMSDERRKADAETFRAALNWLKSYEGNVEFWCDVHYCASW